MDLDELIAEQPRGALFSPCRRWRYVLWRRWDDSLPVCAFIGLNPSTADERVDDPTIRRCISFTRDWGFGSMHMLNLFAWRATDPEDMKARGLDAIGPANNEWLRRVCRGSDLIVAAWGAHGSHLGRARAVRQVLVDSGLALSVLKLTKAGEPGHPLYLPAHLQPTAWTT